MPDIELRQVDAATGKPPITRIADAASFNNIVKKIVERDLGSALNRQDVQRMLDGAPPFEDSWLHESGQDGRSNINFGDGKKEVRRKQLGYYDLTDSVPTLALVNSAFGTDINERVRYNGIMSEELHKMFKDWPSFSTYFLLLVQRFCSHGLGFLYREDDLDWKWRVAGLEDFKVPRGTTLAEEEVDLAICFRDVTAGRLYKWAFVDADESDQRWNRQEVKEALLKASDSQLVFSVGAWEKYQQMLKNNDIWAASMAQDVVKLVHGWCVEYSGKVSQYISLRNGGNKDFLFKCPNRFDSVHQCFTFFPYEVGSNGQLHGVRGRAHEIYGQVQSLTMLRNQEVDNAKFAGSLLLQPLTPEDEEDIAITFYGGAVYIPANVKIQNGQLTNPSQGILPIVQDMTFLLKDEGIPQSPMSSNQNQPQADRTRAEYLGEEAKAAVLDTAALTLFYEPWKRVLNESWRRIRNPRLKATDPGGREVFEFRARCMARGVPEAALKDPTSYVEPMRAIGFGSPANRQAALDQALERIFGSMDPAGQNNLLRDWWAQKVGYAQTDRYVPESTANGRQPLDFEIATLQNAAMSAGVDQPVIPNDHHIIHAQQHQPDIENDLSNLESNQGDPNQLLGVVQLKLQHIAKHINFLKPDKLNEQVVAELKRRFNNEGERVQAAILHAQREAQKQQAQQQQQLQEAQQQQQPSLEDQAKAASVQQDMQHKQQAHEQDMAERQQKLQHTENEHQTRMKILNDEAAQTRALRDAEAAAKLREKTQPKA